MAPSISSATETKKVSLCKHSFPIQPPHGSIVRPGPCDCGLTYEQVQDELRRQAETLIANTAHDGTCEACNRERRVYRFQPEEQPWHPIGAVMPVSWLCLDCWNDSAQATNDLVTQLFEEAAR
ncbi:hypothetical protein ACFC09_36340 [Streptomyces sp. NPDC056161]|uniref:hypothetical protein n=1 Tax=Streptomyces sp. NPDC056161 TaxID=3345732 RepID=UPI0035E2943D